MSTHDALCLCATIGSSPVIARQMRGTDTPTLCFDIAPDLDTERGARP
jgi:hypothetical protein